MDDLIAPTIAENCCDFTALVAGDKADVASSIGRQTAAGLDAGAGPDDHAIAAIEHAFDPDHPGRQEAFAAAQGTDGAVIDDQGAGGIDRAGDPRLARRARLAMWQEQGGAGTGLDRGERAGDAVSSRAEFRPALGDSMWQPACIAIRAAASLVTMPPEL